MFTIKFIKLPKRFREISEINKEYNLGEASQFYFEAASRYPELANRQMKLEVFDSPKDQSYSIDVNFHLDLSLADLISEEINKTIAKTEDSEQLIELKKRLLTAFKTEVLSSDHEKCSSDIEELFQDESSQDELLVTETVNFESNLAEASPLTSADIAALTLDENNLNVEDEGLKENKTVVSQPTTAEVLNIADSKAMNKLNSLKKDVKNLGVTANLELLLLEIEECTKDISEKVSQKLTDQVNERIENAHTEIKGIENTLLEYIEDAKLEFDMSLMKGLSDQINSLHDKFISVKNNVTSLLETKLDEVQAMTKKTNNEYYQLIVELTSNENFKKLNT